MTYKVESMLMGFWPYPWRLRVIETTKRGSVTQTRVLFDARRRFHFTEAGSYASLRRACDRAREATGLNVEAGA